MGYVFAVNGKVSSADIYPSNGLFRKMWHKLLRASITEAISERDAGSEPAPAPPVAVADEFISRAAGAQSTETRAGGRTRIEVNDSAKVISLESRPSCRSGSSLGAPHLHRQMIGLVNTSYKLFRAFARGHIGRLGHAGKAGI